MSHAHDPLPDGRAATISLPSLRGGHDRRGGAEFAADLAAETERTLRRSAAWRSGRPLAPGERWPWARDRQWSWRTRGNV